MSKRSPAPPPDYTAQKGQIRRDTEQQYQQRADSYDTAVQNYNTALSGFGDTYNTLSDNISNLTYADLYDDPTTTENENPYSSLQSQIDDLSSGLGSLQVGVDRPDFASSVGSEYGTVGITNIPDLMTANTSQYNTLVGDVAGLSNQLNDLSRQRENEVNRIEQYRTRGLGDLAGFSTQLGQLGIADVNQMNQLERDLAALDAGRQSFSSPILDQLYPDGMAQFDAQYAGINEGLSDLRGQRQAEMDRIAQYEQGLLSDADAYRNTLGGLTIADEQGITDLIDQIEDRNRQAGRFSSELGFDFNQETGELNDLLADANRLQRDRTSELGRIDQAQRDYLNAARAVEDAAESGSIYSASGIDAIEDALRDARTDMSSFSSALPFDFSGATGSLTDADVALADLRGRRETALDDLLSQIEGVAGNVGGLEAYDEAGLRDLQSQLTSAGSELGRFSGGRVDDISGQLQAARGQIDTRLQELSDARGALETRAQDLLEQINNAQYFGVDDLGQNQGDFDALQAEIELYNAQQALDEITSAENRLNSERQRLERDAEAVAERDRIARDAILATVGESGVPEFQNFDQVDPITLNEYLMMLQQQEDEEYANQITPSAFAQNVIRA